MENPTPRMGRRTWLKTVISLAAVLVSAQACLPAFGPGSRALAQANAGARVLRIGAIPDQKPEKLNRLYGDVARELGRQLGVTVRYVPVVDYTAAVSAFRTGDLDLVWFGGLTGVQARLQQPGARVLAQRDIDAAFRSVFIANSRSGLKPITSQKGLTALKGRRFTFGSESSTSGRLMPQYFLGQAGVKLSDFAGGAPGFSGSHDATIALVQSGAYEAGAVNQQVWTSSLIEGKVDRAKVMAIWTTPPYPDYQWVARSDIDSRFGAGFSTKIQNAILAWKPGNPQQKQILELFGATRFIRVNPASYSRIEQVGRQIGKIR
ncbi:MAG: putative selenate ABC transporter substrate-binding protein [Cyanobium sp.]